MLYSNNNKVNLTCTLFCECNNKPGFQDDVSDAEIKRIIDIDFPNQFLRAGNPKIN